MNPDEWTTAQDRLHASRSRHGPLSRRPAQCVHDMGEGDVPAVRTGIGIKFSKARLTFRNNANPRHQPAVRIFRTSNNKPSHHDRPTHGSSDFITLTDLELRGTMATTEVQLNTPPEARVGGHLCNFNRSESVYGQ